jgi:hypothetical protein
MALIELVDFNDIYGKGKGEVKETTKKTRRSRRQRKLHEKQRKLQRKGKAKNNKTSLHTQGLSSIGRAFLFAGNL